MNLVKTTERITRERWDELLVKCDGLGLAAPIMEPDIFGGVVVKVGGYVFTGDKTPSIAVTAALTWVSGYETAVDDAGSIQ